MTEKDVLEYVKKGEQLSRSVDGVDVAIYDQFGVKRGLRDLDGHGVLTGVTNISKIISSKEVDGQERTEGQEERDVDVTRYVSTTWEDGQQSYEVGKQDEEEYRQQIRSIGLVVLLADRRLDDVVVNHHHKHLYSPHESAGRITLLVVLLIPLGTGEEYHQQEGNHNPYLQHITCNAQVQRTFYRAVGHSLIHLAMCLFVKEEAIGQTMFCAEVPSTRVRTPEDNRQRNAQMLTLVRSNVPLVGIGQVFEHDFRDVEFLLLLLISIERQRQKRNHQQETY